jgi:serine phosphatase RsbU (regulator of sigma subunit)
MRLGILPAATSRVQRFFAKSGDLFALYTDGFLEPTNSKGEEYGAEPLQAELQKHGTEPLESICRSLQESVNRHGAQFGDQSIFLIRKL